MNCVFCKIAAGEIPAQIEYRDDDVLAIADLNPQAPLHLLVLPVRHAANLFDLCATQPEHVVAKLFSIASKLGHERSTDGFRIVVNSGNLGGQTVDHVHVHLLGAREMKWPPG